ncbi:hypothetical protein [Lichenicoccus sp.]|uniref:hypothetical protein n=1 Tax=Lichenicoccus sp. TaxID=2781899 RepID=UPI003D0A5A1F
MRPLATCLGMAGLLLLAACGDLPHPFAGDPGGIGPRLAVPPPTRLAVPSPDAAMLPASGATLFAADIAQSLLAQEVPAVQQPARPGDWRLQIAASRQPGGVVPSYSVFGPGNDLRGTVQGAPVTTAAWAAGNAQALAAAASEAGPKLADLLTGIQAAQMQSDPHSLMNRPAKVYFTGVTGAPGDGDLSLARQMAVSLPDGGNVIQNTARGADFTLRGVVTVKHLDARTDHVEIVWTVTGATGAEAGKVAQLNDIPAHTLDAYWGDVAVVVAREAAGGVRQVITNNSGRAHKPIPPPKAGTPRPGTLPKA